MTPEGRKSSGLDNVGALMRAVLTFMVVLMACTVRPAVEVQMTTLATGGYARDDSGRQAVLARSDAEFRRLWSEKIGGDPVPDVDFGKGVAVFLLAGQRSTGGYSVVPESVEVDGSSAVVRARVERPGRGAITTQALTSPYAVVFIDSRQVETVQWPE